jgi:hypothetical protein
MCLAFSCRKEVDRCSVKGGSRVSRKILYNVLHICCTFLAFSITVEESKCTQVINKCIWQPWQVLVRSCLCLMHHPFIWEKERVSRTYIEMQRRLRVTYAYHPKLRLLDALEGNKWQKTGIWFSVRSGAKTCTMLQWCWTADDPWRDCQRSLKNQQRQQTTGFYSTHHRKIERERER